MLLYHRAVTITVLHLSFCWKTTLLHHPCVITTHRFRAIYPAFSTGRHSARWITLPSTATLYSTHHTYSEHPVHCIIINYAINIIANYLILTAPTHGKMARLSWPRRLAICHDKFSRTVSWTQIRSVLLGWVIGTSTGGGLAHLVATLVRSMKLLYAGPG